MSIADKIKLARELGVSDEEILAKMERDNPDKKEIFEKARERASNAREIIEEILKQGWAVKKEEDRRLKVIEESERKEKAEEEIEKKEVEEKAEEEMKEAEKSAFRKKMRSLTEEKLRLREELSLIPEKIKPLEKEKDNLLAEIKRIKEEKLFLLIIRENELKEKKKLIEEEEKEASFQKKREIEEKRWKVEEKLEEIKKEKWPIEEEIIKPQEKAREIDLKLRKTEERRRNLEKRLREIEDEEDAANLLKEKADLEKEIALIEDNRLTFEVEAENLINKKRKELEKTLNEILKEERAIEEEIEILEKKAEATDDFKEKKEIEDKKEVVEKERRRIEQEKWQVVEEKEKEDKKTEKLQIEVKKLEIKQKELEKKSEEIDDSLLKLREKSIKIEDLIAQLESYLREERMPKIKVSPAEKEKVAEKEKEIKRIEQQPTKEEKEIEEKFSKKEEKMAEARTSLVEELPEKKETPKAKEMPSPAEDLAEAEEERISSPAEAQAKQKKRFTSSPAEALAEAEEERSSSPEIPEGIAPEIPKEAISKGKKIEPERILPKEFLVAQPAIPEREKREAEPFFSPVGGRVLPEESYPEVLIPKSLPKKPKPFNKILIRGVFFILFLVLVGFAYWFFALRKPEEEIISPVEQETVQKTIPEEVFEKPEKIPERPVVLFPQALIQVEAMETLEVSDLTEIPQHLSVLLEKELPGGQFTQVLIKDTKENKNLGLKEFFEAFEARVPDNLFNSLDNDFTLFIYSSQNVNRLGFVAKITEKENITNTLNSWEVTMEKDLDKFLLFLGKEGASSSDFESSFHNNVAFRYLTIPPGNFGICWSVMEDYFIFTASGESMIEVIERI